MDIPRHEARLVVEEIRREHTLDGSIIGTKFESLLSSCLDILSSQLYAKSTHFLLELIQNADDNTYDCATPTLRFTYKPGSLRIDCNETGFTAENVKAICAISQSTKSSKTQSGQFIGEKGIGFKSVFKSADVVWIASREFTFKFDQRKPLGMVTPIWADFPEPILLGFTSMYLRLSTDYEENTLIKELQAFDINWLMFLRNVKEISVQVSCPGEARWEKTVRKTETYQGDYRVVGLHDGESHFQYLVRTHTVKSLPKERRRPSWSQTTVLLAFPIAEFPRQPQLRPENVYAFLPIRNYGLKFLLQGDFLLTANREDIESTLLWNRAIRDASVDAFVSSINHFNQGNMKYTWPFYLPTSSTSKCTFFEPAVKAILADLTQRHVLESCAGTMVKPSTLKYVPAQFLDREGNPFTMGPSTAVCYLSSRYPEWAIQSIDSIGVSHMSSRDFLGDLKLTMTQDPTQFRARPAAWHSQLAEALVKLTMEPDLLAIIQDLCLIPLHDSSWTAANGKEIFFSRSETSMDLPSGIEVLVVDSAAESEIPRRKLLASLGVKDWRASEMCRLVLKVHQSPAFDPDALTEAQLISHAMFLYKTSWQPPKTADLWFATAQGQCSLGRQLYIPGNLEKNSTAARIFSQLRKRFPVIADGYLDALPSDPDWPSWLVRNLGLSMMPRLVTPLIDPDPQPTKSLVEEEPKVAGSDVQKVQQGQHGSTSAAFFSGMSGSATRNAGNHALQDYQMQLMLLERTNKKRLMLARSQETPENEARSSSAHHPSALLEKQRKNRLMVMEQQRNKNKLMLLEQQQNKNKLMDETNPVEPAETVQSNSLSPIFSLSEEFKFLFCEANTSDVLQLLRDNWQHYSQWIDGAHMQWQKPEFRESCRQLKNDLSACRVECLLSICALQEAVAPKLDSTLDKDRLIPAVKIQDPTNVQWALLSHFGVIVKLDIHYYLRCLIAISRQPSSDANKIAYIYEQIQARYRGNEQLINAAFHENDIVLLHKQTETLSTTLLWTNMRVCISMSIAIENQYKTCSYLFRCLSSPSQDPIASVIATASLITSSSKLDDISRFFRNVNAALKDVNPSQIAQVLTPLQTKPIFPILDSCQEHGFDRLLGVRDTNWFIADSPVIRTSFLGNLPLLALSLEEIHELDDLFRVLWLGRRMLSKMVSVQAHPKGRITTDWNYTISMRQKSPFIKALVPHSYDDRTTIMGQLDDLRVSIATEVSQAFSLNLNGTLTHGRHVPGQISLSRGHNSFHLIMTQDCANAKTPPYNLVTLIADTCAIRDPAHYSLLYTLLGSSDFEEILSVFSHRGLHVKDIALDKLKIRISRGDLLRIPLPPSAVFKNRDRSFRGMPDMTDFDSRYGRGFGCFSHQDRRLPIVKLIRADESLEQDEVFGRFVHEPDQIEGWEHTQHLGEHMVSKLLRTYLEQAYDPETHWTSALRTRSGYAPPIAIWAEKAAFTFMDPKASEPLTRFIIEHGQSETENWKEKLQETSPVYHLEVVVSGRGRTSMFVICSSQLQRIRDFRMLSSATEPQTNISVLVRVNDVYSGNESSIDIHVDPWYLFDSNSVTLEERWLFRGAIGDGQTEPGKKRLRTRRLSVPWATRIDSTSSFNKGMTLRGARNKSEYSYEPLTSGNIRLLYLLPGEKAEQLQGVIIQVPHDGLESYRAISYVWGNGRPTQQVITPDGILRVTVSLASCLRRLRHKSKPAMLWVDGICINQSDNKEKAQQVRMMATVFQRAAVVYGFVAHSKTSDAAVEMLMQIQAKAMYQGASKRPATQTSGGEAQTPEPGSSRRKFTSTVHEYWPKDLPQVSASWTDRPIPQLTDAIWTAIGSFFADSWFRRAWIIQETVAAHKIRLVSGRWIIDWDDLYQAMEIVDRELQVSDLDFSKLRSNWEPFMCLATQREWEKRDSRWSLLILLENYRHAKSTLARDRLFALLGLASDGNLQEFEPDYASPLKDILLRYARLFVHQGKGMYLLYRAGLTSNRFPSWIPDWTVKRPSSLSDSSDGGMPFSASGSQRFKMKCEADSDALIIEGYTVDVVEKASEASNVEQEWLDYFREVEKMVESICTGPNLSLATELAWKVPIAGAEHPKVAVPGDLDFRHSYNALRALLINQKDQVSESPASVSKVCASKDFTITHQGDGNLLREQSSIYVAALQDRVKGWRFIVTKRGYSGVAPPAVRKGDTVAVMKGGCVPFILQRSTERPGAFRLIGECYVHEIMHGEGLLLDGAVENEFCIF